MAIRLSESLARACSLFPMKCVATDAFRLVAFRLMNLVDSEVMA